MARKSLADKQRNIEAVELVKSRFNVSKNYVQPHFSKFQEYYQLYRSFLDKSRLPWRANLFIPKTFEIVETIAPRIAQAQKTFKTLPVEGTDTENAEAYTDLLKFQFQRDDIEDKVEEWVKETLIYGTGVAKCMWDAQEKRPIMEVVDVFDFFPDPKARNDSEFKYVIHRLERDIEDLEKNPNYDEKVIEKLKKEGNSDVKDQERQSRESLLGISSTDGTRKRFEVLEYHGYFQGKISIITVVGDELLRLDESPYGTIPFVVIRDQIVPHELYGVGEIEPIVSLQHELNDIRNQRMDNVKINLNTMWKVVAGGVQFEDELVSRPGGIIHLTRPDGLIPNDRAPIEATAFTEESVIKSDMERSTGANSAMSGALVSPMGGTQGGVLNRTATAYQGAINQGDKRFASKIQQVKRGLIKIGRLFLEMDQQFITDKIAIRILGEEGQSLMTEVLPEDIKGDFDLTVEVEYLDEFQQAQQDIQLLQVLGQVPGLNVPAIAADILEKLGKKNVSKYLAPPPPPPPKQPEPPKIMYQLRGDMAPDAVAQLLDKTDGIKTNPEVVASQMRATQLQEEQAQAKVLKDVHGMRYDNKKLSQDEEARVQEQILAQQELEQEAPMAQDAMTAEGE